MPYCMCKENWDHCKCDQHICPKHKRKVTARPVQISSTIDTSSINFSNFNTTFDIGSATTTGFN